MSFDVSADAYGRYMGRFSEPLAAAFARLPAPASGQRALDVGCGPGALTAVLAAELGAEAVARSTRPRRSWRRRGTGCPA